MGNNLGSSCGAGGSKNPPAQTLDSNPLAQSPLRLLALHGWRTSGDILTYQTGALQAHLEADFSFPTAPHAAKGPPDSAVAEVYGPLNMEYFEWFLKEKHVEPETDEEKAQRSNELETSMNMLLNILKTADPPFDGILGFSQGANMATRLAHYMEQQQQSQQQPLFRFVILIGGVPPYDLENAAASSKSPLALATPSLHIHGLADPLLPYSQRLVGMYAQQQQQHQQKFPCVLQHEEGHNIPSMKTGLYPKINEWLVQFKQHQK